MPTSPVTCFLVAAALLVVAGSPAVGVALALACGVYEFVLPWLAQ